MAKNYSVCPNPGCDYSREFGKGVRNICPKCKSELKSGCEECGAAFMRTDIYFCEKCFKNYKGRIVSKYG